MRDRADNCVDHLLDREPRPDGGPHGRLDHGRSRPDALRRRVPADARRGLRVHPPGRCGDRWLERAVRAEPRRRPDGHHRDEPPRVAVVGARRRRPPASRSPRSPPSWPWATRSTRSRTTSPRPRRPASSPPSTTSSPRCRAGPSRSSPARPACSARRCSRWARRWPSVARSRSRCRRPCGRSSTAASGWAVIRASAALDELDDEELLRRAAIGTPDRPFQLEAALRRGITVEVLAERTKVDPWFLDQLSLIVEERAVLAETRLRRDGPQVVAAGQAARLRRRPARLVVVAVPEAERARSPPGRRRAGHLQDRRHLRGRVRGEDAVPLLHLRGRGRGHPLRAPQGADPRLGPEPHRAGHRVRLLLRARQLRPRRCRLRDGDAQLQPRDGLHRLRHLAIGSTSSRSRSRTP